MALRWQGRTKEVVQPCGADSQSPGRSRPWPSRAPRVRTRTTEGEGEAIPRTGTPAGGTAAPTAPGHTPVASGTRWAAGGPGTGTRITGRPVRTDPPTG